VPPGRSWAAWSRLQGYLVPEITVADLGCGEGYLALEAARWAKRVVAIDRSPAALARAKKRAARRGIRNVSFRRGDVQCLPLDNEEFEVVLLSQVLHCLPEPAQALREAHRILTRGGRLLVMELKSHDQEWVRERFGDAWLGFEPRKLERLLRQAGFRRVHLAVGARRRGDPFIVLIGAGSKAA
jgi:ArsR family transcriptional regulator